MLLQLRSRSWYRTSMPSLSSGITHTTVAQLHTYSAALLPRSSESQWIALLTAPYCPVGTRKNGT